MSQHRLMRGFTLIELVISITVLGIVAASVVSVVSTMGKTKNDARDIAIGGMLLQACAEKVMAVREVQGFSTFSAGVNCTVDLINASKYGKFTTLGVTVKNGANNCVPGDTKCTVTITLQRSNVNFLKPLTFDVANF